ncbi:MAG: 30S ribosome-binding factor RbfA [Agarilytica sp.]
MPREFKRADRVSDAIQRSLARIIQSEVRDPRLGMVNINAVSVSQDLTVAKVYVTFVGQDSEAEDKIKVDVLNNASSFMRSLMAKDVKMRIVPRLQFIYDASVVRGQQMTDLIDKALSADRAHPSDDEK